MSLETKTRIICDGCGAFVEGKSVHLATSVAASYWDALDKAKAAGWLRADRAYRRDVHYCKECADKPQKPVKTAERKKKCQKCREISQAEKSRTGYWVNMGWARCEFCGWKRTIWQHK